MDERWADRLEIGRVGRATHALGAKWLADGPTALPAPVANPMPDAQ